MAPDFTQENHLVRKSKSFQNRNACQVHCFFFCFVLLWCFISFSWSCRAFDCVTSTDTLHRSLSCKSCGRSFHPLAAACVGRHFSSPTSTLPPFQPPQKPCDFPPQTSDHIPHRVYRGLRRLSDDTAGADGSLKSSLCLNSLQHQTSRVRTLFIKLRVWGGEWDEQSTHLSLGFSIHSYWNTEADLHNDLPPSSPVWSQTSTTQKKNLRGRSVAPFTQGERGGISLPPRANVLQLPRRRSLFSSASRERDRHPWSNTNPHTHRRGHTGWNAEHGVGDTARTVQGAHTPSGSFIAAHLCCE